MRTPKLRSVGRYIRGITSGTARRQFRGVWRSAYAAAGWRPAVGSASARPRTIPQAAAALVGSASGTAPGPARLAAPGGSCCGCVADGYNWPVRTTRTISVADLARDLGWTGGAVRTRALRLGVGRTVWGRVLFTVREAALVRAIGDRPGPRAKKNRQKSLDGR